jgi:hypothetical protein
LESIAEALAMQGQESDVRCGCDPGFLKDSARKTKIHGSGKIPCVTLRVLYTGEVLL